MNSELRRKKLIEVKNGQEPFMTGVRIRYEGETKPFEAFKIPLTYLIYNKYNARIGSLVKSFEKQFRLLNAEIEPDAELIERFLWESNEYRNKTTMDSLVADGQQKYGIVTDDGVIVDGNRRAMLLNRIYRDRKKWEKENHNVGHCQFFVAVVLPEGADPREVRRLETTYQMGEDEKLDYGPIEKYLRCKDLRQDKFKPADIAQMMGEAESRIKEWLEIMTVMDDYLETLGYDGIYTRLDKREGQFVDLNKYLKTYETGSKQVTWNYQDADVSDLKSVCFDYIRAQYEGKEFRYIARPHKTESIFCQRNLWNPFLQEHSDRIEPIKEKTIEELREENPGDDLSNILEGRDQDWAKKAEGTMRGNLNKRVSRIMDHKIANQPKELLQKVRDTLNSIYTNVEEFYTDDDVLELLKEINSISWEYRKLIEKERKSTK